jgi:hypothetical protein
MDMAHNLTRESWRCMCYSSQHLASMCLMLRACSLYKRTRCVHSFYRHELGLQLRPARSSLALHHMPAQLCQN